jgi:hypothetical protein
MTALIQNNPQGAGKGRNIAINWGQERVEQRNQQIIQLSATSTDEVARCPHSL